MVRFSVLVVLALAACMQEESPALKAPPVDIAAGKAIADRECKGCHGAEGKSIAPAIPHLAAQREGYLFTAIQEYKQAKRLHAALRELAVQMSDAEARNIAAYYASLPPVKTAAVQAGNVLSPFEHGKRLAEACAKCHGAGGSSVTSGIPSLAGQQSHYLVTAIQEHLARERKSTPMPGLPSLKKRDMEALALYFASQTPTPRERGALGDPAAGEPLTAVCRGCHGPHGVSLDSSTPSLAGQEPRYLVEAIKAYRTTRQRESMREYVRTLTDRDIDNMAAFYSVQKSRPSEQGQTLVQDLIQRCERCHGDAPSATPVAVVPKIAGQDRDYLIMTLRAYRDDRRASTAVHRMNQPYSDSIIESLAAAYAAQPAK
ncbi:MAG TPA: c-type cytochrome [Burkholderiales bacterium]|nr:c-type cytochrome [Burkholderiales bacterium]